MTDLAGRPRYASPVRLVDLDRIWLVRFCDRPECRWCLQRLAPGEFSRAQGIALRYPALGWGGLDVLPFDGAPDSMGWTTRWRPHGSGLEDLTLLASPRHSSRSIQGRYGHYFVTQGYATPDGKLPPELERL